jgi:hypothetical protein
MCSRHGSAVAAIIATFSTAVHSRVLYCWHMLGPSRLLCCASGGPQWTQRIAACRCEGSGWANGVQLQAVLRDSTGDGRCVTALQAVCRATLANAAHVHRLHDMDSTQLATVNRASEDRSLERLGAHTRSHTFLILTKILHRRAGLGQGHFLLSLNLCKLGRPNIRDLSGHCNRDSHTPATLYTIL